MTKKIFSFDKWAGCLGAITAIVFWMLFVNLIGTFVPIPDAIICLGISTFFTGMLLPKVLVPIASFLVIAYLMRLSDEWIIYAIIAFLGSSTSGYFHWLFKKKMENR